MMAASELRDWRNRHFGRYRANARAAEALALPLNTFRKQLAGISPVSAQTERIARMIDEKAAA